MTEGIDAEELYMHCFCPADDEAPPITPIDPKVAFKRVLKQIETMELRPRPCTERARQHDRGYIFAIHEQGVEDLVMIGYGGKTPIRSLLRQLQISNPRPLIVASVLQRTSYNDASAIFDLIHKGLCMYRLPASTWYRMDNCLQKITGMFGRIDKLEAPEVPEIVNAEREPPH